MFLRLAHGGARFPAHAIAMLVGFVAAACIQPPTATVRDTGGEPQDLGSTDLGADGMVPDAQVPDTSREDLVVQDMRPPEDMSTDGSTEDADATADAADAVDAADADDRPECPQVSRDTALLAWDFESARSLDSAALGPLSITAALQRRNVNDTLSAEAPLLGPDGVELDGTYELFLPAGLFASKLATEAAAKGGFTIELKVAAAPLADQPTIPSQPRRLLSWSGGSCVRNLTAAHLFDASSDNLTFRIRNSSTYPNGYLWSNSSDWPVNRQVRSTMQHIVFTYDDSDNTLRAFIDGAQFNAAIVPGGVDYSAWDLSFPLVMGDESDVAVCGGTARRTWAGTIAVAAIYAGPMAANQIAELSACR